MELIEAERIVALNRKLMKDLNALEHRLKIVSDALSEVSYRIQEANKVAAEGLAFHRYEEGEKS